MKFVDTAEIKIKSGRGGDGAVTFRREMHVPMGGPDGGNGGKGGDVLFIADKNLRSLMDFRYKTKYMAENGENGKKQNQYGKKGPDLLIKVPVGTSIIDVETGLLMTDLTEGGASYIAAAGGKGGLGNANFKNSVRRSPNFAEAGGEGLERAVRLELRLLADVGLIGFPNAGKSSLLSVVSKAKPKIADYHFTTLHPNLGVVSLANTEFVVADIPGLIEGAADGAGLGHEFLRHIERTKLLIHVIDAAATEGRAPLDDYLNIENELSSYSKNLLNKPQIVALNKMDIADEESEGLIALIHHLDEKKIGWQKISAATTLGVAELMNKCAQKLDEISRYATEDDIVEFPLREPVISVTEAPDYREIHIEKVKGNDGNEIFSLSGKQLKKVFDSTNFNDYSSLRYLYKYLEERSVIDKLKEQGLKEGDTVRIDDLEFEFTDE